MRQSASIASKWFLSVCLVSVLARPTASQDMDIRKAAETAEALEQQVLGRKAEGSVKLPLKSVDSESARAAIREQIAEQIDNHRRTDQRVAAAARNTLKDSLNQLEMTVQKAMAALDRWESDVRTRLQNRSGSQIASDSQLLTSFQDVFDELDPKHSQARAELNEALNLCTDIQSMLQHEDASQSRARPMPGLLHRVTDFQSVASNLESLFSTGVTKIELWAVAAREKKPSTTTLQQALRDLNEDLRPPEIIGKDLLRIRSMAFILAAKKFSNTLTEEAIMRSNVAQVRQFGVMTGQVAYERSSKEKNVTLQVTKCDSNTFAGRLIFDNENRLWEIQGNLTNRTELYLTANTPEESEMAFKGTLENQRVSGRWYYPGRIGYRGTFLFHLAN